MQSDERTTAGPLLKYKDMLYRIAFSNVKNKADAEDAVQETYFRLLQSAPVFESEVHGRAWLIRVMINICYDMHKNAWYTKTVPIDQVAESEMKHFKLPYKGEDGILWRVMELPAKYRNPLYLFYYEDYAIKEIAQIMELTDNTVKTRLRRGREMIKERLLREKERVCTDEMMQEDG